MTWRMPSETEPQDRVWMAFPPQNSSLGVTAEDVHEARDSWARVAHAVSGFERVTMAVDPADLATARTYLSSEIELVEMPLDDAWMRDIGPTFVKDDAGRLGGVDWVFNGWGRQNWASWGKDSAVGAEVVRHAGAELIASPMVNEGGGIQVDGLGTVLVTDTVQLDPDRNPRLSRADVEAELARTIGTTHAIWLPRGLTRDNKELGTRGHVDIVVAIPSPGVLLVHSQRDESHPDFPVTRDLVALLAETRDAHGRNWEIVEVPAPRALRDGHDWVDYSYINHLVVNGGVIACSFGDAADAPARRILEEAYAGRQVVTVDARAIFARGGGIHCITQQQPA